MIRGKIAGTITDATSGDPLVGANIVITERWNDDVASPLEFGQGAASDFNGQFYILNVRPGVYSVKVDYIGYGSTLITNVEVFVDKTTPLNCTLSPKGD